MDKNVAVASTQRVIVSPTFVLYEVLPRNEPHAQSSSIRHRYIQSLFAVSIIDTGEVGIVRIRRITTPSQTCSQTAAYNSLRRRGTTALQDWSLLWACQMIILPNFLDALAQYQLRYSLARSFVFATGRTIDQLLYSGGVCSHAAGSSGSGNRFRPPCALWLCHDDLYEEGDMRRSSFDGTCV
ncbi:hypothetical protein OBBRIDRAFT_52702 [Obba rivulosa]|uniref:Uncharacterized protein n=1 Tax=Obba rivulosa TaxID=1052685 RepID=A0A8E2J757_9APHY|nr:hypothetical protein OBBRIDRAFT_52702 [Obba rivulosa]